VTVADLSVDPGSTVPPFEQVRAGIATRIVDGRLVAGTKLPTVRALADELGLAVNTVARAYRELEVAGLVATRSRAGTVVTANGDTATERLQAAAEAYARLVHELGTPGGQALDLVRVALLRTSPATNS
jgi:DNA-binding transcriptional regulator YhcF (GntR family)